MSKKNPKPSARVKDANNLADLQLRSHQEAHNQAVAIANNLTLASDMSSSNDTLSKGKLAPETILVNETEDEGAGQSHQTAQAPNTSSVFTQCSFNF